MHAVTDAFDMSPAGQPYKFLRLASSHSRKSFEAKTFNAVKRTVRVSYRYTKSRGSRPDRAFNWRRLPFKQRCGNLFF